MKRRRLKIPFPIIFLLLLSFIYILSSIIELRYVKNQKKIATLSNQFTDSFDYSFYSCFAIFIKKITVPLYYIGVFYFSNAIKTISNTDYEFCTFFVISRWIILELPFNLIQKFVVDSAFNMNNISFSSFMKEQLFNQFLFLMFLYFAVFLFLSIGQKFTPFTIDTTIISGDDNFDLSSSSYISNDDKQLPPLDVDKEPEPPLMSLFTMFYVLIIVIFLLLSHIYDKQYYKKNYLMHINGKLRGILNNMSINENMEINNTMIYIQSKINDHVSLRFSNNIPRTIFLSDTLVSKLSNEQLTTILTYCYYRNNSQEGFFLFISYFLELLIYPFIVKYILKTKIDDDLKLGNFISSVIPLSLVYMFIINTGFDFFRCAISNKITYNSDSFSADMGLPVEDALVRVFYLNKDDVMHSFLYSTFMLDSPTLQRRLKNVQNTKQNF